MKTAIVLLISLIAFGVFGNAQTNATSDDLFEAARSAAFKEKNEIKAKELAKEALSKSPQYADVQVFLGRLYSWNKQYDTAIFHYEQVLSYAPKNEEASIAYVDAEYWNDHYDKALTVCNKGLSANPTSEELLLRKAKILKALKQYKEASKIADQLLQSNKRNTTALVLASSVRDAAAVNKLGVSYGYSYFDKQFATPWHLPSISYSRYTKIGSVGCNLNYAKRFGKSGWQGEIEAYPHISKTFYSYLGFGYTPGESVFPKYRAGFSLYANPPMSYEAEAGIRYLNFGSSTYVYTLYLGKYYSNFLLGARTYLTPGSAGASQSYNLMAKYYLGAADDYIGLSAGTGISPDERLTSIQYNNKGRLSSKQASVTFSHSIKKMNIISFKTGWINQEYKADITGNEVDISIGLQRRF